MIKKAMIMAAGVGSRLGALSDVVPKPLVPLANVPVMDILLNHLSVYGITNIIANTFYKAEDIQNRYKVNSSFNYIQEKELSGTAGGLKKCENFFYDVDDFIVMSGDGLTDINIEAAYNSHKKSNSIATIVTKDVLHRDVSKYGIIVPDKRGFVLIFQEKPSLEEAKSNLANTGIYIFKKEIFNYIPKNTFFDFAKNLFPLILNSGIKINTYNHGGYWSDIGSIEQYKQSNKDILNNMISSFHPNIINSKCGKYILGENSIVDRKTASINNSIIGSHCKIGRNATINNSVIWDNVTIEDNLTIDNSIILSNTKVSKSINNEIIANRPSNKSVILV